MSPRRSSTALHGERDQPADLRTVRPGSADARADRAHHAPRRRSCRATSCRCPMRSARLQAAHHELAARQAVLERQLSLAADATASAARTASTAGHQRPRASGRWHRCGWRRHRRRSRSRCTRAGAGAAAAWRVARHSARRAPASACAMRAHRARRTPAGCRRSRQQPLEARHAIEVSADRRQVRIVQPLADPLVVGRCASHAARSIASTCCAGGRQDLVLARAPLIERQRRRRAAYSAPAAAVGQHAARSAARSAAAAGNGLQLRAAAARRQPAPQSLLLHAHRERFIELAVARAHRSADARARGRWCRPGPGRRSEHGVEHRIGKMPEGRIGGHAVDHDVVAARGQPWRRRRARRARWK